MGEIVLAIKHLLIQLLGETRMNYNMSSSYLNQEGGSVEFPNIRVQSNSRSPPKKGFKPICMNLADTQYDVIEKVGEEMGWKLQYNESKTWDLKWNDSAITGDFLSKMSPHQKINHYPGMNTLHRKNTLAKNLYRLQEEHPEDYDFFPRTFLLPHDHLRLKTYFQETRKRGILKTFIVKPEANCQGRGIFLTQDINQIFEYEHCIVQKYVSNPLLYKGLKFDLRIYALVAGCDPLRIYIYNQGLVRFATEKYEYPTEDNMDDLCMHLTNYAINKDNPKYVFNESLENLSYGHKKSLAEFFQTMKALGYKAHQYWSDIKDIINKTMISGQPHLQHEYRMAQPNNLSNNMCFEILGFDFMIDNNGKVYLLEINHTPSFTTDTPLDELIKSNLIRDTLVLMNITPRARNQIMQETRQTHQRRVFTGKTVKLSQEQRKARVEQLQQIREEYEKNHLGSFERIFPSKVRARQQKYLNLLQTSEKTYKELSGGNNNNRGAIRKSPAKFRIVKRINTNQSYGEAEDLIEMDRERDSHRRNNIHKSLGVVKPQQPAALDHTAPAASNAHNMMMHMLSKRSGLKTSNQQMTMFSRKMDESRKDSSMLKPRMVNPNEEEEQRHERIAIDIHV